MGERFTSSSVPDAGIQVLFGTEERWQAWVEIEAALALTQADFGMIPREAAKAITSACPVDRLDPCACTGWDCTDQSSLNALDRRTQSCRR